MPCTAPPVHLFLGKDNGVTPKYELYRFVNGKPNYPEMIELLSRHPYILGEPKGLTIEPIPIDEEISSLPECTRRQV